CGSSSSSSTKDWPFFTVSPTETKTSVTGWRTVGAKIPLRWSAHCVWPRTTRKPAASAGAAAPLLLSSDHGCADGAILIPRPKKTTPTPRIARWIFFTDGPPGEDWMERRLCYLNLTCFEQHFTRRRQQSPEPFAVVICGAIGLLAYPGVHAVKVREQLSDRVR